MRSTGTLALALLVCAVGISGKVFKKCELARLLENKYGMAPDDVKSWVCIAEYESTFNTEAVNKFNWDGSFDYGLFQLNDKYWCDGHRGKNVCKMACSSLLDDDLTDDMKCIRRIIKDTERWKGKGTGLTAWVAYVNRCQNRDLDEYISECVDSPKQPTTPGSEPIDNFIPRVPDEPSTSSIKPTTTASPEISSPDPTKNEVESSEPSSSDQASGGIQETAPGTIIPSARIPYPSHMPLRTPPEISRRGSTAIHVQSSLLPMLGNIALSEVGSLKGPITSVLSGGNAVFGAAVPASKTSSAPPFVVKPVLSYSSVDSMPLKQVRVGSSPLGPSLTVYEKIDGRH